MQPDAIAEDGTIQDLKSTTVKPTKRRKCKELPNTATKAERIAAHKQKMARKDAERKLHASRPARNWLVIGNLSRRHMKRGLHPSKSYS
jgi:hypothetical protein